MLRGVARRLKELVKSQDKEINSIPNGVFFLTFSLSKSPLLMAAICGNRASNRSVCVPFPTPGAPTRMMRAAFLSCLVDMLTNGAL